MKKRKIIFILISTIMIIAILFNISIASSSNALGDPRTDPDDFKPRSYD